MSNLTQYWYKYKKRNKDIEYVIKSKLENGNLYDENGNEYVTKEQIEKYKENTKNIINDFLNKFIVYYNDDEREFHKKYQSTVNKYYYRSWYEIVLVEKANRKNKINTLIGLPNLSNDNRYELDLGYIFDALSFTACSSWDVDLPKHLEKEKDNESNKLWKMLDILQDKESFWIDILGGYF